MNSCNLRRLFAKFEGLYLFHQFFYDLLNIFGALSLSVVKKRDQENDENDLDGHYPRIPQKLYKTLPRQMAGVIQSKGPHTKY